MNFEYANKLFSSIVALRNEKKWLKYVMHIDCTKIIHNSFGYCCWQMKMKCLLKVTSFYVQCGVNIAVSDSEL